MNNIRILNEKMVTIIINIKLAKNLGSIPIESCRYFYLLSALLVWTEHVSSYLASLVSSASSVSSPAESAIFSSEGVNSSTKFLTSTSSFALIASFPHIIHEIFFQKNDNYESTILYNWEKICLHENNQ